MDKDLQKMNEHSELELFVDIFETADTDDTSTTWEVFEAEQDKSGVVDGYNILGRAVGPFFVVDGKSQNNRFYEKKLWERVLGDSGDVIGRGQMLGTIGHQQPLDDAALLAGMASHRVNKLWIDEGKGLGMGEVYILNTPAGRTLNGYLRGGVQFPVSSRGYGKYNGAMEDGTQIVDSESYKLETFDFVRTPGIKQAIPKLVEQKEEEDENNTEVAAQDKENPYAKKAAKTAAGDAALPPFKKEDEESKGDDNDDAAEEKTETREVSYKMDDKVLQRMTEEKIAIEADLQSALGVNAQLSDTIDALKGQVNELRTTVDEYRNLGTIEEIGKVMDVTEGMLENRPVEESEIAAMQETLEIYETYGTPDELEELFDKFENYIDQYEELGHPDEISQALDGSAELLEAYQELGNPAEISEAFNATEVFMTEMAEIGSLEELAAVCDLLEAYQPYGTPSQLAKAFSLMDAVVENTRNKHVDAESDALATEYGVDKSVAESMVESMGSTRAKEVLGAINESRSVTSRYKVGSELNENAQPLTEDVIEDVSKGHASATIMNRNATTRVSRLFEQMSR